MTQRCFGGNFWIEDLTEEQMGRWTAYLNADESRQKLVGWKALHLWNDWKEENICSSIGIRFPR